MTPSIFREMVRYICQTLPHLSEIGENMFNHQDQTWVANFMDRLDVVSILWLEIPDATEVRLRLIKEATKRFK